MTAYEQGNAAGASPVYVVQNGANVDSVNPLYVNIGGGSVTINATIPATVTAIGGGGSMSVGAAAGALGVASANATAPLAAQLMVSDGTNLQRLLSPLILGNGVNGNNMIAAADWLWNGASWDKARGDSIGGAVVSVSGGVITVSGGAGSSTVTVAAATINAATITGGSVSISGTPTVALSGASTVTATIGGVQSVLGANVTPTAGTTTIVSTANSAVTVFSPGVNGGFVKNPNAATAILFVDMVNAATTVEGGTNRGLMPGEIFNIPAGNKGTVTANSADSVHAFVAVKW